MTHFKFTFIFPEVKYTFKAIWFRNHDMVRKAFFSMLKYFLLKTKVGVVYIEELATLLATIL